MVSLFHRNFDRECYLLSVKKRLTLDQGFMSSSSVELWLPTFTSWKTSLRGWSTTWARPSWWVPFTLNHGAALNCLESCPKPLNPRTAKITPEHENRGSLQIIAGSASVITIHLFVCYFGFLIKFYVFGPRLRHQCAYRESWERMILATDEPFKKVVHALPVGVHTRWWPSPARV